MVDDQHPDDAPIATCIEHWVCEHGSAWLRLTDDAGRVLALASMDPMTAMDICDQLSAQIAAWLKANTAVPGSVQ